MQKTTIEQIAPYVGEEVELTGWAYNFRSSGKIFFLQLRDGSGRIQAVFTKAELPEEEWNALQELRLESSVTIRGKVKQDDRAPSGFELEGTSFEALQIAPDDYPIGKKDHGPDFLLDNRHLWLRSERQWAIQRVRNTIIHAIFDYFRENDFIKIDSPILTPNACEGTTELFEMDYFDLGNAYLSQSGQLYLEAAVMSHGKVFDFGPVFRAEKSKTRRHLTEFWMMDAELIGTHADNMRVQEELILRIIKDVLEKNRHELTILERDIDALEKIKGPFPILTHEEAVAKLKKLGSDIGPRDDLGGDDETMLTEQYDTPIFIEKYPAEVKAFYMKREGDRVLGNDMLAPEGYGEIIGGSEREIDYDTLLQRIRDHKLPEDAFSWYLDLRKYGSVPHAGFGLGLERTVGWICGTKHVRETIPFPRLINRLTP